MLNFVDYYILNFGFKYGIFKYLNISFSDFINIYLLFLYNPYSFNLYPNFFASLLIFILNSLDPVKYNNPE